MLDRVKLCDTVCVADWWCCCSGDDDPRDSGRTMRKPRPNGCSSADRPAKARVPAGGSVVAGDADTLSIPGSPNGPANPASANRGSAGEPDPDETLERLIATNEQMLRAESQQIIANLQAPLRAAAASPRQEAAPFAANPLPSREVSL